MNPAAGDESGLVLLFITNEELLENRAAEIDLGALLDGLNERGVACQLISHQPVDDTSTIDNQPTVSKLDVGVDRIQEAAPQQPPDNATDNPADELVALVTAALDGRRADVVIMTSATFAEPIAAACETRGIPTAVICNGNAQRYARSLGGATAVLVASQASADYLRNGFGLPAVCMPPLLPDPVPMTDETADRAVVDSPNRSLLKQSVAEYSDFFEHFARAQTRLSAPTNGRAFLDSHDSQAEQFVADNPWPTKRPAVIPVAEAPAQPRAESDRLLALARSVEARLIVELGAGSGALTQSLAQQTPTAMIVAIDCWRGTSQSPLPNSSDDLPAAPFDSFLSHCWEQRQRVIPVRRDLLSGLQLLADAGLQPDLVYVHGLRDVEAVVAELRLARRTFPQAILLGDDYNRRVTRQAVNKFARESGLIVDRHPAGGWRLLERWQISAASHLPPGRNEFVVLVPHHDGIAFECEHGLRQLEEAGVRVVRREGCSAIDVARNEMISEALHDGAEAIMFIDSDIGFDPLDALQLLARPEDVVSGVYAKKNNREMASQFAENIKEIQLGGEARELYPLKYAATGFLRIRAEVLHRMISELRLPLCNTHWGRGMWPFFQPMIVPHSVTGLHYLGEDWAFSHRLAEIGVTPLADTSIRLWHWGRYGFSWEDAGQDVSRYANYHYTL